MPNEKTTEKATEKTGEQSKKKHRKEADMLPARESRWRTLRVVSLEESEDGRWVLEAACPTVLQAQALATSRFRVDGRESENVVQTGGKRQGPLMPGDKFKVTFTLAPAKEKEA